MELYQMGVITDQDCAGVPLEFGSAAALAVMTELAGKGLGFGKLLGLGAKRLCEHFGHPEVAMHVKGQEFAGYDGRALQGMGLGFATSNRGACHLKHDVFREDMSDPTGNGKAVPVRDSQDQIAVIDTTGLCCFPASAGWNFEDYRALLNAACGQSWSKQELLEIGERIWTLERLFNQRAGFTAADDTLPSRLLEVPAPSGTGKGRVCELPKMLAEYYELRGWNADGSLPQSLLDRVAL
jgi:aldehyde:ferredoxin oxidoreductase